MHALRKRLSTLFLAATAAMLASAAHAATVSIGAPQPWLCGHGVVCDGHYNAFRLSDLESGAVQLPVDDHDPREFLIVNDTGAWVTTLQLQYIGTLDPHVNLSCGLDDLAWFAFDECTVAGQGRRGSDTHQLFGPITPPVQFTFTSGHFQWGLAPGALFDISADAFSGCGQGHGGFGTGYITGLGAGSGSGGSSNPGNGNPEKISLPFAGLDPAIVLQSSSWLDF